MCGLIEHGSSCFSHFCNNPKKYLSCKKKKRPLGQEITDNNSIIQQRVRVLVMQVGNTLFICNSVSCWLVRVARHEVSA